MVDVMALTLSVTFCSTIASMSAFTFSSARLSYDSPTFFLSFIFSFESG